MGKWLTGSSTTSTTRLSGSITTSTTGGFSLILLLDPKTHDTEEVLLMKILEQERTAVEYLRACAPTWPLLSDVPLVGLILGSGLGSLAKEIEEPITIPYADIPGFPLSHVSGHAGNLVLGRIGRRAVAALAGRAHLYEGWSPVQATLPVRVLAGLGVKELIVSNASGGINPRFRSGQVFLIDQHIDAMRKSPFSEQEIAAPIDRVTASDAELLRYGHHRRVGGTYDQEMMERAESVALSLGFSLHRGTYLATLGPTYETRAEYRMFARLGADMVGMSTVPEVLVARSRAMRVLAFSIVTNVATPDAPTKTEHSEVLDWSKQAQSRLVPLIKTLLNTPKPSP